jgi:signal transduction histidine kinase
MIAGTVSLTILVIAYAFMWFRGRQPSMGLWGLGWAIYSAHFVTQTLDHIAFRAVPWRFISLATLGLSAFLLYVGTVSFVGRPARRTTYVWAIFPILWALVTFIELPFDQRLAELPIFIFAGLVNLLSARTLSRDLRFVQRRWVGWTLALTYVVWAGLTLVQQIVASTGWTPVVFSLTANGLALGLAFFLVATSLIHAEQEARRRAERLKMLSALSVTTGEILAPDEMLRAALTEFTHLLRTDRGIAYLSQSPDDARESQPLTIGWDPPGNGCFNTLEMPCVCNLAMQEGRMVSAVQLLSPADGPAADCPINLAIPLLARDRVLGVLGTVLPPDHRLSDGERRTLETLGRQLGVALENARLYAEQQRRAEEAHLLLEIANAVNSTLELKYVLKEVSLRAARACEADRCTILLFEEDGDTLIPIMSQLVSGRPDPEKWRRFIDSSYPRRVEDVPEALDAVLTRQPQFVPDARASSIPKEWTEPFDVGCVLIVPLIRREHVIGLMGFDRHEVGHAFSPEQTSLAMTIGAQAAVAIENASLYQQTSRRLAEAKISQEISLAAASTLDFDEVLERAIGAIHRTMGIDYLNFMIPDEEGQVMVAHPSMVGFNLPDGETMKFPVRECITGQVYLTGQSALVSDVKRHPCYAAGSEDTRSELAVPVKVGNDVAAVLNLESPETYRFTEEDLHFFSVLAAQLGVALENARLYQQLEERSAQIHDAVQRMEELDQVRNQIAQNVSHELRTPLTLIQGYTELMVNGDLGEVSPAQKDALETIHDRVVALARLIYDLTALQSLPKEALRLAPVSLTDVVQHVVSDHRIRAERAGIVFEIDLPDHLPPIKGDAERLSLVFLHLIDNAIKFSPDGGAVQVCLWEKEDKIWARVADQGIGIAPEFISRVFERFYQADGSTTRRFGGMGVGLSLVWEVVEAHGGSVSVDSTPGEGSTFTVVIPIMGASSL